MTFCPNCGEKLLDDALFCSKCGAKILKSVEANVPGSSDELKAAFAKISQELEKAFSVAVKEINAAFQTANENIQKSLHKEQVTCPSCGEKNSGDAIFCYKCGKKMKLVET